MKDEINKKTTPIKMRKRIGSTTYEVNCYFNHQATETVEEKLLRIIKNDLTSQQKMLQLRCRKQGCCLKGVQHEHFKANSRKQKQNNRALCPIIG